jgi:hypothetical protein
VASTFVTGTEEPRPFSTGLMSLGPVGREMWRRQNADGPVSMIAESRQE